MVPWSELEPDQAETLLAVLLYRKPSAHTMKACDYYAPTLIRWTYDRRT